MHREGHVRGRGRQDDGRLAEFPATIWLPAAIVPKVTPGGSVSVSESRVVSNELGLVMVTVYVAVPPVGREAGESVVKAATLDYRRESDQVARFLKERCSRRADDQASGHELYEAYSQWCSDRGEKPESNNTFPKRLAEHGIGEKRTQKGRVYKGVGLKEQPRAELIRGDQS